MMSPTRVLKAALAIACAALGVMATPAIARSQAIQIRVVDSTTVTPLGGALIALLDPAGAVAAEGITSENGYRTFFVTPGQYRVRVRRVGYRPFLSGPLELSRSRVLTVPVESQAVVLSTIVISSGTSCRSLRSAATQELGTVWGEATKALESSKLMVVDLVGVGRAWTYESTRRASSARAQSDTVRFTVTSPRPFAALNPESLARGGYVFGDAQSGWDYFGPDETVLLAPSFARTHCFRLVRDRSEPGLIGVAFEPVPGRRTADIAGIAWLDERTSELRRIVFRYVNAGLISRHGGGGETHFIRLRSGAWIISSWHLRAPILVERRGAIQADGFMENGGGVLQPD
ncbi:MAG: carboxypeptidase regulatory-like domain-containing protein [Gemmatimonadaceae bacterium]|nr:carboxypeptidase regulatory-like domain-containing protein [Gemmatimonadaceae bacterium]